MEKIKTALLAYGGSGKVFHAPFLAVHPGFELTGAWERSKQLIQQDYPTVKSYASLEELLQDDVELVVVNTPVDTHYAYAKQVLLAGKHALVEKAFTTTAKEAEELRDLAREKKLSLTVYQNRRWDSDLKTAKSVLDENTLGEIVEAEIRFDRYNPLLSPKAWKEAPNAGAGVVKDLGSHLIDQALYLFGFPEAVFADFRTVRENSLVVDNMDILLYYTGKRVRLHAGFFNKEQVPGFILQGRNGSFFKPRADVQEDELKKGMKPSFDNWGEEPTDKAGILNVVLNGETVRKTVPTLKGNYLGLFDGVYAAIRENKPEPVTAEDGVKVMRIMDAATRSNEQKRAIEL